MTIFFSTAQKFGLFITRFTKQLPSVYFETSILHEFWAYPLLWLHLVKGLMSLSIQDIT